MPFVRFIGGLSLWSGRAAALLVVPLVMAMVYEVISRYVFSAPTLWAFEVSYMMMGAIFMLAISYALQVGQHVNVDFIHDALPKRLVAVIDTLAYLVLTGFAAWLTLRSGEGSGLSAWNPPIWPYRNILALGFGLFALQCLAKAVENLLIALGRAEPEMYTHTEVL
jgi:TRAP-type mannitol/chloroaromatic compound transport system permease small subunit